ncbi:fungal-specific transcription factor domain-containing protein [Pisolithus microcarpus]|nr:fungal-specific transcription factor domain-containing protein [Pisolithus microcarpus]
MESSVRDAKSSDPQSVPRQPILQASAAKLSSSSSSSRRTRQKKPTDSPPKSASRPAPQSSSSRRPDTGRRSSTRDRSQPDLNTVVGATTRPQVDNLPQPPPDYSRLTTARAPTLQPYHGISYMMNPNYPVNPSPFTQHQSPPAYPAAANVNAANGSGVPGHPHQYYPMHPASYGPLPHGYAPYTQYPQQMVVYAPPRSTQPPTEQQQPVNSSPAPTSTAPVSAGKRKRRSDGGHGRGPTGEKDSDQEGRSPADAAPKHAATTSVVDTKKRTKTQRACDSCRTRKIRCDVLGDTDPPLCQHCKQYGFECTFFLPITETRFKKKKQFEEEGPTEKDKDKPSDYPSDRQVFGPTNAIHLLHSQATISSRVYESYDQRYHHTWEVSKSGDGLISVHNAPADDKQSPHPKPIDLHVGPEVIQDLVNAYFREIAPILPIITQAELLANPSPPPVLIYSMCLVAAARREVSQSVFDSIRYIVNNVIKTEDVLSTASIANVQALLILSMVGDSHSQYVPNALSALWIRLGTAIRMAQDLGLHRAESVKQNIELRRRLWAACVVCDRWTSLTYGHPYMIDVQDCDACLPSSGEPNDLYMVELARLSIILGRVLKTIYSPSGLRCTNDEMLYELLADLNSWKANLPESLKYQGPETPSNAGLLHLLYSCVCMIFWRVFMRISYTCPEHLKFGLTVETWTALVELAGESIDWLDTHERVYDVWLLVAYAATSCALVQYHTWARRQDADAAIKLRKLRDCVRRWESAISPEHMSAGRKTAEIISLLYEATQGPPLPLDKPPLLNPTGGVKGRQPLGGLEYKKDPSRPGGGVFVAHGEARKADYGMPKGTIITSSDEESEEPPAAGSSSLVNIRPLTSGARGEANVNPALNYMASQSPGNVQVLNVLDGPQASGKLQQFAMADVGLLEGIPGGMFDWGNLGQWGSFFTRFNSAMSDGTSGGYRGGQQPGVAGISNPGVPGS